VVRFKEGKGFRRGVRAVWLYPHKAWPRHCGDGREVATTSCAAGKIQTRLDMKFRRDLRQPKEVESKKEWEEVERSTGPLQESLETDFKAGRPAS